MQTSLIKYYRKRNDQDRFMANACTEQNKKTMSIKLHTIKLMCSVTMEINKYISAGVTFVVDARTKATMTEISMVSTILIILLNENAEMPTMFLTTRHALKLL